MKKIIKFCLITASLFLMSNNSNAQIGETLDFDGVDDYLQAPNDVYFDGDFTIEAWVYPKNFGNWSRIIDFGNGAGNNCVLLASTFGTSGAPGFYVGGSQFQATSPLILNLR